MNLSEMIARLAAIKAEGMKINEAAVALGIDLSEEHTAKLEALAAEKKTLEPQIEELEAKRARGKALAAEFATGTPSAGGAPIVPPEVAAAITNVTDLAASDPMSGFRSGTEYFTAVMQNNPRNPTDERLIPLATLGSDEQRGNSDSLGGFLIPTALAPNLLSIDFEGDPTAGRTTQIPMGAPTVKINARVDKVHSTSVSGGLKFYRRQEAAAAMSSKMEFEQIKLDAANLTGLAFSTDELIADSPQSIAAILANGFQSEYGAHMLNEKINGNGTGEFEGILASPAKIAVAKTGSQAAKTITGLNLINMRARCYGYGKAIWIANHDVMVQLFSAHIAGTNSDIATFHPSLREDMPDMLLGRPIFFSEYAATLGTEGDIILADWSQYLVGDYQAVESASSMHVRFESNEQCFRVTARNDGRCWWRTALTPAKSTTTLSPIVTLAVRA